MIRSLLLCGVVTTEYTIRLPDVDVHFHGQDFFEAIQKLSNRTDQEGRPLLVTENLTEAIRVVQQAYLVCRQHLADTEFNIRIVPNEKPYELRIHFI